jgi:hypothetical protein
VYEPVSNPQPRDRLVFQLAKWPSLAFRRQLPKIRAEEYTFPR